MVLNEPVTEQILSLSELPPGSYVLQVVERNGIVRRGKFVKE